MMLRGLLLFVCMCAQAHAESRCGLPPCEGKAAKTFVAKVIAVIDGDTVLVLRNGKAVKIRLADIDAPEKGQDFGMASRRSLAGLVLGKQLRVSSRAVDKYGRIVAQLSLDRVSVNEEQVRRGLAWQYSRHFSDPRYIALQEEALRAGRGLWAQARPVQPWQWRKQHPLVIPAGKASE